MTFKQYLLKTIFVSASLFAAYLTPTSVSAALITATLPGSGNECSGQGGFSDCQIFSSTGVAISPVIAKFASDLTVSNLNSNFPTIDGTEFDLTSTDIIDNSTGDWVYTKDDADDPDVRFWVTFAQDSVVRWNINDADSGLCGVGFELTTDCMNAAITSTSGFWETELNNGNNRGLSHITFFDTGGTPPTTGDTNGVPVPPAVWLFGTGLIGMLGFNRKKA